MYYKIPYCDEKNILINNTHISNNNSGRESTYKILKKNLGYWFGIYKDILEVIKKCPYCLAPNKYKSLIEKSKIIIEDGPHYRYIGEIFQLPYTIYEKTGYKYVPNMIDHFKKWYGGYLLKNKTANEILGKIDIYFKNFGLPKILQVDNGGEFSNHFLEAYCDNNNVKIIYSSPYHP